MKNTLVYSTRTDTKRQSIRLLAFSWQPALQAFKFLPCSARVHKGLQQCWVLTWGYKYILAEFAYINCVNNEDRVCCQVFLTDNGT